MSERSAREKILAAAEEIARHAGPGNLSLDAVAARAGVSKGGLLYHFPSKGRLLEAVVERFLSSFARELEQRSAAPDRAGEDLLEAYLDLFIREHRQKQAPPSGLLAALAEDPSFMAPVRRFERDLLDRLKAGARDPALAMVVFMALHGLRSMALLNVEITTEAEFAQIVACMRRLAGGETAAPPGEA